MSLVSVESVNFSWADRTIVRGWTGSFSASSRVGIAAPNGTGKSTLLRIISGELPPDQGVVSRTPGAVIRYLPQVVAPEESELVADFISRTSGVQHAERELVAAAEQVAEATAAAFDRYERAVQAFEASAAGRIDSDLPAVMEQVGGSAELLSAGMDQLSGGERSKIGLAVMALTQADLILLDEPTNNLDLAGIDLMERLVRGYRGGVVLVSHDREFLARTVETVLVLDEFSGEVSEFHGGWEAYEREAELRRRHAWERYERYDQRRLELEAQARRQREWARQGEQRAQNVKRRADNDKHTAASALQGAQASAGKAARATRELDRLDVVEEPREAWELRLTIPTAARSGQQVCVLREAMLRRGHRRWGPIDAEISWGDRIQLSGPNGAGKSTFIDAITQRLEPESGTVRIGASVTIGELDQHRYTFETRTPVAEVVAEETGLLVQDARTLLAKFRVGADAALRPASSLSPGERTRAGLAIFQARAVNFLILDEPTNHLDIEAIAQLESALDEYVGTLLVVSHDRRLIQSLRLEIVWQVSDWVVPSAE